MKSKGKYILNIKSGTLHLTNGCYYAKGSPPDFKYFDTEDEAIAYGTKYFKHCKNCFKEKRG